MNPYNPDLRRACAFVIDWAYNGIQRHSGAQAAYSGQRKGQAYFDQ
jgi:hypothetical protein